MPPRSHEQMIRKGRPIVFKGGSASSWRFRSAGAAGLALATLMIVPAFAQGPDPKSSEKPITYNVRDPLPPSVYTSAETQAIRERIRSEAQPLANKVQGVDPATPEGALAMRAIGRERDRATVERMLAVYPAQVEERRIGGVSTQIVSPPLVANKNRNRILINLHGGGFFAGKGALAEVIPIASLGQIKVVTIDYRMWPEFRFPAASEDVAAVYRELLKTYQPENIGIYGCSAGAVLTAQSLAWFQTHGLPRPGAAAMDSGGAVAAVIGDSYNIFRGLRNLKTPLGPRGPTWVSSYFADDDFRSPLQSPAFHPRILAKFPPTLVLTATRDTVMSEAVYTHSRLIAAGAESDLHVWEGAGHCFTNEFETSEAREAYDVMIKFFDRRLGGSAQVK